MLASWGLGNPELGVVMLGLFVVFIMFGFPIAFTLMALGFGFGYFAMGDIVFALVVQRAYSVMTNDTLVAIPLFVFMGYIIERAEHPRPAVPLDSDRGRRPFPDRLPSRLWSPAPCSPPQPASWAPSSR